MHLAAVLAATDPALQFVHSGFEGTVKTVGAALTTDHRAASVGGNFDVLAVLTLPAVVLMLELHIETLDGAVQPFYAGELLPHIDAVMVGNLDIASRHLDISGGGLLTIGKLIGVHRLG